MSREDQDDSPIRANVDDATLIKEADEAEQRLDAKLDAIGRRAQDLVGCLALVRNQPEWEVAAELWREPLKWRNPDGSAMQWNGKGREPEWFNRWIKQGGNSGPPTFR